MTETPHANPSRKLLGELLIEDGALAREQLEEALDYQKNHGGLIGQILIRLGYITEENLVAALGRQLGIPYLPLQNYSINPDVMPVLGEEFCRRHTLVPFDESARHIFIVMADPTNQTVLRDIETRRGKKVQLFIATSSEILSAIEDLTAGLSQNKRLEKPKSR